MIKAPDSTRYGIEALDGGEAAGTGNRAAPKSGGQRDGIFEDHSGAVISSTANASITSVGGEAKPMGPRGDIDVRLHAAVDLVIDRPQFEDVLEVGEGARMD